MNPALSGSELPEFTFTVADVKITEFVTAIGDDNPIHRASDAAAALGYDGVVVPLTMLFAATAPGATDIATAMELDFARGLIVGLDYEFPRLLQVGERLTCRSWLGEIIEKNAGAIQLCSVRFDLYGEDGELAQRQTARFLERRA